MEKVSYLEYEVEEGKVLELEIADKAAREEMSSMKTNIEGLQKNVEDCDICGTVTGNTVNITDSAEAPFEELAIYGESKQLQTTGKNKLPFPYYGATNKVTEGVNFTTISNSSITVNGTSTGDAYLDLYNNPNEMLVNEPIIFSKDAVNSITLFYFERIDEKWSAGQNTTESQTEIKITPSANATGQIFRLTVQNGKTANNITVKPMIRLASNTDSTWEPYTNGPSPNPDYPQPIENKVVNRVDVLGKNELDCRGLSAQTTAGITFTPKYDNNGALQYANVNGTWDSSNTATNTRYKLGTWYPKTKGNYILSGMTNLGEGSFLCLDKNGDGGAYEVVASTSNNFTVAEDANYYDVWLRIANGTSVSNLKVYPMIRLADVTDDTYKPYQEQTVYLTNFYAMNGLNGVRDCIDAVRGVFSQNVYAKVFTGDESFRTYTPGVGGVQFGCEDENIMQIESENVLCTHLPPKFTWNVREDGISLTNTSSVVVRFRMESLGISTVEDLKAKLKEWYDAGNPMVLYAPIKTPKETALPAADIQALQALHTYSPNTTVNADAPVEVKYFRNTENGNVAGLLKKHTIDKNNPHGVTKEQLGLDKVNNTADINKYVYHAQKADEASWADSANDATNASMASLASKAMCDKDNNEISSTYMKNNYFKEMTGTLTAGSTSLTLSHEEFSQGCTVEVYVLNKGVYTNNLIKPTDMSVSMVSGGNESLNLEFESQSNDLDIKVRFW